MDAGRTGCLRISESDFRNTVADLLGAPRISIHGKPASLFACSFRMRSFPYKAQVNQPSTNELVYE
jgi:hypothetical protein